LRKQANQIALVSTQSVSQSVTMMNEEKAGGF